MNKIYISTLIDRYENNNEQSRTWCNDRDTRYNKYRVEYWDNDIYQFGFDQVWSLRVGLKWKVIRVLTHDNLNFEY